MLRLHRRPCFLPWAPAAQLCVPSFCLPGWRQGSREPSPGKTAVAQGTHKQQQDLHPIRGSARPALSSDSLKSLQHRDPSVTVP